VVTARGEALTRGRDGRDGDDGDDGGEPAVIVAHFGIAVLLRTGSGELERVRVRRGASHVVGEGVVLHRPDRLERLPSSGVLQRRDSHGRVRSIAANLDILGIVVAPRPISPLGFIDRAVVAARVASIEPIVVINKCDLAGAEDVAREMRDSHPQITHLVTSATTGEGLDAMRACFASGRRGAFVGTSGVGKTSLLNALCPELDLQVGEINERSGLGRHVTSNATLHRLPEGGELIDTPGFRDFGPVEISPRALADHFPGFEDVVERACRFRDCLHRGEPGCGVLAAVDAGRIPPDRHAAYIELLVELEAAEQADRRY
jgi:ribosome biogenesis GTPase